MKLIKQIITTSDGSTTIHLPEWNESYHSRHGAIQESKHVFINTGLKHWLNQTKTMPVNILEIGFGTGLNCFLTVLESSKRNSSIDYTGVEAYPITEEEIKQLNYCSTVEYNENKLIFENIHQAKWNEDTPITPQFKLFKRLDKIENIEDTNRYDIIYFDAFGAQVQPELWTETIFKKMHNALKSGGILVTYAAKGSVRRSMQAAGFQTERLPGPPGKREMLRATKL